MKAKYFSGGIIVFSFLTFVQYILVFFIFNMPGLEVLHWVGWAVWVLSLIFGLAPIFILRRLGDVAKGESYVMTRRLVDTSLYAIVRHPQYLGGILFNIALMFLGQHWLVILLGAISAVLMWIDIQAADQDGIAKFGDAYREYMERVPQINFILGLIRLKNANRQDRELTGK